MDNKSWKYIFLSVIWIDIEVNLSKPMPISTCLAGSGFNEPSKRRRRRIYINTIRSLLKKKYTNYIRNAKWKSTRHGWKKLYLNKDKVPNLKARLRSSLLTNDAASRLPILS